MDNDKYDEIDNDKYDKIDEIRGTAYALSNAISDFIEEYDVDMWDEILDYLENKRELQSDG